MAFELQRRLADQVLLFEQCTQAFDGALRIMHRPRTVDDNVGGLAGVAAAGRSHMHMVHAAGPWLGAQHSCRKNKGGNRIDPCGATDGEHHAGHHNKH